MAGEGYWWSISLEKRAHPATAPLRHPDFFVGRPRIADRCVATDLGFRLRSGARRSPARAWTWLLRQSCTRQGKRKRRCSAGAQGMEVLRSARRTSASAPLALRRDSLLVACRAEAHAGVWKRERRLVRKKGLEPSRPRGCQPLKPPRVFDLACVFRPVLAVENLTTVDNT